MDRYLLFGDEFLLKLEHTQWKRTKSVCIHKIPNCIHRKQNGECCSQQLVEHCCKHVLFGNDYEQTRYVDSMKDEFGMMTTIPHTMPDFPPPYSRETNVITDYEKLSRRVLKDSTPFLAGEAKSEIRIVCQGKNNLRDLVDFIAVKREQLNEDGQIVPLGIVSSFFDHSLIDAGMLYRLVHQKYYEGKSIVNGMAPGVFVSQNDSKDSAQLLSVEPCTADYIFDQSGLLYYEDPEGNHASGAIYYMYKTQYEDSLKEFYLMIPSLAEGRINRHIGRGRLDQNLYDELSAMKQYDHVYFSRIILEYLRFDQVDTFMPQLRFGDNRSDYLPSYVDFFPEQTNKREYLKYEIALIQCYVRRMRSVFSCRFTDEIINSQAFEFFLSGTEDEGYASIIDQTAFSFVDSLFRYFAALYVYWRDVNEIYKNDDNPLKSDLLRMVREEINYWNYYYAKVMAQFSGKNTPFDEWMKIYDDLFQFRDRVDDLLKA